MTPRKPRQKDHNSAEQYRAALDALGWSQGDAARFLDIDPRTSRHYALGTLSVPSDTAMLLAAFVARRISPKMARKLAGLPPVELGSKP